MQKPNPNRRDLSNGDYLVRDGWNVVRYREAKGGAVTVLGIERFTSVAEAKRYMASAS